MPPVAQYVFAETRSKMECFTAGRHECLPYSVSKAFSKRRAKHQFVELLYLPDKHFLLHPEGMK